MQSRAIIALTPGPSPLRKLAGIASGTPRKERGGLFRSELIYRLTGEFCSVRGESLRTPA